jgi:hypothetical protein
MDYKVVNSMGEYSDNDKVPYNVIHDNSLYEHSKHLNSIVKKMMNQGYIPLGGVSVMGGGILLQAMVKQ